MTRHPLAVLVALCALLLVTGCATREPADERSQTPQERAARINTQLGVEYLRKGEFEQAMAKLERAIRQDPRFADSHAAIAVLYERLGQEDEAGSHYRRAVQLAPDDPGILNNYGRFLCQQGEIAEAERLFRRAADNPLYRSREVPLTNAGLCLLKEGRVEQGEQYLLRALEINPRFAPALLRLAELRNDAGHHLSARGFYQRYLEVAPQTAATLWLGIQIERALGDRDAVASYSLLLRSKFPDSEETRQLLEMERNER